MPEHERKVLLFEPETGRLEDVGDDKKGNLLEGGFTKVAIVIAHQSMLERAAELGRDARQPPLADGLTQWPASPWAPS